MGRDIDGRTRTVVGQGVGVVKMDAGIGEGAIGKKMEGAGQV